MTRRMTIHGHITNITLSIIIKYCKEHKTKDIYDQ